MDTSHRCAAHRRPWLGHLMTIAAMICNAALLNSTILTATPIPFTLAEDGYLPPFLTHRHPRYGTPWIAILISAAIYASLALNSLGELISIYVWMRAATTVLTVLSAWDFAANDPICRERSESPAATSDLST